MTGPNVVLLFLHKATQREKKSTLTFNFYPVTQDWVFESWIQFQVQFGTISVNIYEFKTNLVEI